MKFKKQINKKGRKHELTGLTHQTHNLDHEAKINSQKANQNKS